MPTELEELLRKTDTLTAKAQGAVLSAVRDIRKEILYLAQELDLARSADNREAVYAKVASLIGGLRRRLDDIFTYADENAIKLGSKYAQADGELKTRIDRAGADAIIEAVRANGERNLAATMTNAMQGNIIDALRNATVSALREQALTGGTNRQLQELLLQKWTAVAKDPKNLQFVDRSGRTWDTQTYLNMNARTNATRIFNDSVVSTVAKDGKDLVMVSRGGDPECRKCFAWEGRILSITGKTKGFPTYDEAREAGLFHPNCTHTLETVDEDFDADEIELQAQFAPPEDLSDDTAMDDQRYEIDIARKMMQDGLDPTEARIAVDRDNLSNAIRQGLITDDAEKIVAGLSDEQITALCPNGNPPEFAPAKDADGEEGWNHGRNGGVLYIGDREHPITVERLVKVSDIGAGVPTKEYKPNFKAPKQKNGTNDEERDSKAEANIRKRGLEQRAEAARKTAIGIIDEVAKNMATIDEIKQGILDYAVGKGETEEWANRLAGSQMTRISGSAYIYQKRSREASMTVKAIDALKKITGETAEEINESADAFEQTIKAEEERLAEIAGKAGFDETLQKIEGYRKEAIAIIDAMLAERKRDEVDDFKRKTLEEIGITQEEARKIRTETEISEAIRRTSKLNDGLESRFRKANEDIKKVNEAIDKEREELQARHLERVQPLKDAYNSVTEFSRPVADQIKSGLDFIQKNGMEKEYKVFASKYLIHSETAQRNVISHFIAEKRKEIEKTNERELVAIEVKRKNEIVEASPIYALAPENRGKVSEGKVSKVREETWKVAKRAIERIADASVIPDKAVEVKAMGGDRAYHNGSTINLAARNGAETYAHEYAHFIEEWNPHVHQRCQEFLRYRSEKSGDEVKSLRVLTGNRGYEKDEYAIKDNFFSPYCGKIYAKLDSSSKPASITTETGNAGYAVYATEILSKGLERLLNDAQGFYREDREYFDFTLNLLQGRI